MLVNSHVQVSPEGPYWIPVRTPAGPLINTDRVVLKPLLCYFSSVLGTFVSLEGELSAHSEVVNTLEKVFVQDINVLGHIYLSFNCNQVQLKNTS